MAGVTSNPGVNIQLLPAAVVDAFEDRRDIIFGQIAPAGTAVSGQLYTDVHNLTTAEIKTLFGAGSEISYRIFMWLAANGSFSPLDVIAVDNTAEAKATASIAVTGTASADGVLTISVVDERQWTVDVAVSSGDINTVISAAIETALNSLTDPVFTVSESTGTVTLTAVDEGAIGNDYGIKISSSVPNVTTTLTGWTGGGAAPTVTSILDPIDGRRYTGLSWPESWFNQITIPVDELESRFNPANAILDGTVFSGLTDTLANVKSAIAPLNSKVLVLGGNNKVSDALNKGPAILQPADWVMTYFQGVRARRLTPSAPIADFILATNGPLDSFGGPGLASLPYFNTPLARTPVTNPENLFSNTEQNELEAAGFTTYGVNSAGNAMVMGEVATTWTTDAGGNPNVSFHFLNYVDTGSVSREIFFRVLKSVYAQSRLTEGDLIPQKSMANAESIKAELLRIYKVLAETALTQAGREAESFFSTNTTVTVDLSQGLATIAGPLPIVTQLRNINYALQFAFTTAETGTQIKF